MDNQDREATFLYKLMAPVRKLRELYSLIVGEDDRLRSDQGIGTKIGALLTLPFRLAFAFIVFMVQAWTTSRNGFSFLRGFPAAFVITGFVLAAVFLTTLKDRIVGGNVARYLHAQEEFPDKPEYAEGFIRKAVELEPEDIGYKYQLGLAMERSGDLTEARAIMSSIAIGWKIDEDQLLIKEKEAETAGEKDGESLEPEFKTSLNDDVARMIYDVDVNQIVSSAHLWLANDALRSDDFSDLTDMERFDRAREEYEVALRVNDGSRRAMAGLSKYWEYRSKEAEDEEGRLKHLNQAESYLDNAINGAGKFEEMLQILYMPGQIRILKEAGREQEARRALSGYSESVGRIARRIPDQLQIWISLVKCSAILGEYDQGEAFLNEGLEYATDPQIRNDLNILKANVYLLKANDYKDLTIKENYINRLNSLCRAVKASPSQPASYDGLMDYMLNDESTEASALWMRECLTDDCPFPAIVHVLLGFQDIADGDFPMAQQRWQMAELHFALSQYLVNNLVEAYTRKKDADLDNVRDILTVAMQMFPDQAVYYQTRGRLNARAGKFEEAIADYQIAIDRDPAMIRTRVGLVEAYRALDMHDKARELLADLRSNPGTHKMFVQRQLDEFLKQQGEVDRILNNEEE